MIKNLLDKIFFAVGVIIFLQIPHFINQYAQRMGGFIDSQKEQIAEYQAIANRHFDGNLNAYINRLKTNSDPAIIASADQIEHSLSNSQKMSAELLVYQQEPLWYQMPYFFGHMRVNLAKGTFYQFQPGLPINLWAWGYGLIGGLLFSLLFSSITKTPTAIQKLRNKRQLN